ncbi:MAG: tail fiber domain-containing protein [Cyclobacteriaceae bacterium]
MKTLQHKSRISTTKRLIYLTIFQGLIFILGTILSISVSAQDSQKLSFQGYLEDAEGVPLEGEHQLTFTMYWSDTSTRPLWQETQEKVALDNGIFSVILGSEVEMYVDFDSEVWLGVQLGTDAEFSPRTQITSVPRAYSAEISHGMYGTDNVIPGKGSVGIGTIDPTEALDVRGTVKATKFVGDGSGLTNVGGESPWTKSGNNISFTSGYISVGNDDPIYAVDASGNIRARSALIAGSTAKDGEVYIRDISNAGKILLRAKGDSYLTGGNVGIMNDDPAYALDASGNIRARSALIAGSTAKDGEVYIRDISNAGKILLRAKGDSYLTGGNVGIMNDDPAYALDASGNIRARSALIAGSTAKDGEVYIRDISNAGKILLRAKGDSYLTGGNVGIMNDDPAYALDASGNIRARSALIAGSTAKDGEVYIRDISNAGKILLRAKGDSYMTGGNVGIMNDDPAYALDASGNIRARSALIAGSTAKDGEVYIRDISNAGKILLKANGDSYLKGGNVGFMNDDPIFTIDASGNIRARSDLIAGSTAKDGSLFIRNISNANKILLRSNGDSFFNGGNVGINTSSPDYQLDVNGVIRGTNVSASDERWKKNIRPIEGALRMVKEIRGVRYDWKVEEYEEMNFTYDPQVGLIAQEVEEVLPELVITGVDGYKSVNYTQLTAVLVEAIKEQQALILSLQEQMKGVLDTYAQLEKQTETKLLVDTSNSIK